MKILAVETATALGGVALIDDEKLLAEYGMDMAMAHGEMLMVMVDRILKDGGLGPDDLDALAVSIGPGSFTGLRVGVSTVKGLATGTSIPIAAVSTLEAMAWNAQAGRHIVCPMIDARKGEVYTAQFSSEGDGTLKRVTEDQVLSPEVLCVRLREASTHPAVFLGDGAFRYREVLVNRLGRRALFPPAPISRSFPSMVAWLGLQKLRKGETADTRTLAPMYVRRPDAEVNWEKGIAPRKLNLKRAGKKISEHGEREGEAPSGSARGSGDPAPPVRARGRGASEERSPHGPPDKTAGDASPYKSRPR